MSTQTLVNELIKSAESKTIEEKVIEKSASTSFSVKTLIAKVKTNLNPYTLNYA